MLCGVINGTTTLNNAILKLMKDTDIKITKAGTVVLLATGGTIAGIGKDGKSTGYRAGQLSAEEILEKVPGLEHLAPVVPIQICNINSDDITSDIWIETVHLINSLAANPLVSSFVILHGTDTMEETAYFLNLTLKTEKPVIITGSMRPATSMSADSYLNIYESVLVATSPEAVGKGVLIVFSDQIFTARSMTKASTYSVKAISGGESGSIGIIRDDEVFFYGKSIKKHTIYTEFDVSDITTLPRVSIVYFATDQNPAMIKYAASISDGLVIAGAGAGEFSKLFAEEIKKTTIPVVISSRVNDGIITQGNLLCKETVAANNLQPQKAAILLRLALTKTTDYNELFRIFSTY